MSSRPLTASWTPRTLAATTDVGPLGFVLLAVDFTGQTPGTALASAPAGTWFRAGSGYSVQSSASAIVTAAQVAAIGQSNTVRIGTPGDGRVGAVFEHGTPNYLLDSGDQTAASWSGSGGTRNQTGVAGVANTATDQSVSGGSFGRFVSKAIAGSQYLCWSVWTRSPTTGAYQISNAAGLSSGNGDALTDADGAAYVRASARQLYTAATGFCNTCDSRDCTAINGGNPGALHQYTSECQLEDGQIPTEQIPTSGGSATRAGEAWQVPAATVVRGGGITLALLLVPKGSRNQYATGIRIWTKGTDYAEVDPTTGLLTISIGGQTNVSTTALNWFSKDSVRLFLSAGGDTTRCEYETSGDGVTWGDPVKLAFTGPARLPSLTPTGSVDVLGRQSDVSHQFTCWLQQATFYEVITPSWYDVPAAQRVEWTADSRGFAGGSRYDVVQPQFRQRNNGDAVYLTVDPHDGARTLYLEAVTEGLGTLGTSACLTVEPLGYAPIYVTLNVNNLPRQVTAVSLPGSGPITVKLRDGSQWTGADNLGSVGTWARRAWVSSGTCTLVPRAPATRLLICIMDSLYGLGAVHPTEQGWPFIIDDAQGQVTVVLDGFSSRTLHGELVAGRFDAMVARIAAFAGLCSAPANVTVLFCLGRNDWYLGVWSLVSAWQTGVQQFFSQLAAAVPQAKRYYMSLLPCPFDLANPANGLGQQRGDFDTALAAGALAGDPAVLSLSGPAMFPSDAFTSGDGVHETDYGLAEGAPNVYGQVGVAPTVFSAGPYSAGNTLASVAATGLLDVPDGTTLIVQWYQTGNAVSGEPLAAYANPGLTQGWSLRFGSSGALNYARYPNGAITIGSPGLTVGKHCAVVSHGASVVASVDGAVPTTIFPGSYAAPDATGVAQLGSLIAASAYNAHSALCSIAVLPYAVSTPRAMAISRWMVTQHQVPYAEAARQRWEAWTDYDPTAASTVTRGSIPVTLVRSGTVAKTAR